MVYYFYNCNFVQNSAMNHLAKILFVIAIISVAGYGDDLSDFHARIAIANAQIDSLERLEGRHVAKLDVVEQKIAIINDMLLRVCLRENSLKISIKTLEDSVVVQEKQWMMHEKQLSETLRRMYIMDKTSGWELALLSDSIDNFAEGLVYLEIIADARNERIGIAQSAWERYSATVALLKGCKDSLEIVKKSSQSSRDSLNIVRKNHRSVLTKVRNDKDSRRAMLAALEKSLEELEKSLAEQTPGGAKFAAMRGKLPCPLGTKCKILRGFGIVKDPNYGTSFNNPGVDIIAKPGQEVHCAAEGKVSDVVWLPGYQYVVIVSHGGSYYTVYGNLGNVSIEKGDNVERGSSLGNVASDSWLDEKPKLHFEIRKGKSKENPIAWMK